jgi:hypothetical protein
MENNVSRLKNISSILGEKIVTERDINEVLAGIVEILSTFKKDTSSLNEETKSIIESVLRDVYGKHDEVLEKMDSRMSVREKGVLEEVEKKLTQIKTMEASLMSVMDEAKKIKKSMKDGKTPIKGLDYFTDEDKMEFINGMPVPTPEGEAVKSALETLSGEKRLDAKYIKNIPMQAWGANRGTSTSSVSTFTSLIDVPSSYTGQAGNLVRVNATNTGLEFFTSTATSIVGTGVLSGVNYTTTFVPVTTPVAGTEFTFIPNANNPASATLNGALIKESSGSTLNDLEANDLIAGGFYKMRFNGTNYILQSSGSTSSIPQWLANTSYSTNDVVKQGQMLLRRTVDGVSAATFTLAELNAWTVIANYTDIQPWAANTIYAAGTLLTVPFGLSTRTIKVTANMLSAATFSNTEAALYTLIKSTRPNVWTASTYMYQTEQFYIDDRLVQRISNGISGTIYNQVESDEYIVLESKTPTVFSANTYYYYPEEIFQADGSVYYRNLAGTSGASFNATEKLNWTLKSGSPTTAVTANYTVVETDNIISCGGATSYTVTIPANRVNKELHFVRQHPSTSIPITIATSGAETIVNPATGLAGATTVIPGLANTYAMINYYKVGNTYQAN